MQEKQSAEAHVKSDAKHLYRHTHVRFIDHLSLLTSTLGKREPTTTTAAAAAAAAAATATTNLVQYRHGLVSRALRLVVSSDRRGEAVAPHDRLELLSRQHVSFA